MCTWLWASLTDYNLVRLQFSSFSSSSALLSIKKTGRRARFLIGGDGGNRTRVRKFRSQMSTSVVGLFWRHPECPGRQGHFRTSRAAPAGTVFRALSGVARGTLPI